MAEQAVEAEKKIGNLPLGVGRKLINFSLRYGIYLVFIVLCVVVALGSPVFLTVGNLSNILLQTSAVGIIAVGMTYVIIARGIDVSVGAIVALGVIVCSMIVTPTGGRRADGSPASMRSRRGRRGCRAARRS